MYIHSCQGYTGRAMPRKGNQHVYFFFQAEDGIRDHCVTGVQTCALPISTRSGPAFKLWASSSLALLMLQFWQKRQPRLHPAVPKLKIPVPGRKWFRGFFSIGSIAKPVEDRKSVV